MKVVKTMKTLRLLLICILLCLFLVKPVSAMHIMEGYLPPAMAAFWFVLFIPFFIAGLVQMKRMVETNQQSKVFLALAGAFVFILSALKIPSVTGSTSHPTGVGLGTSMFGPSVMSVLGAICLLFQALFLAHGGLTTLGANAFSMAVVGPFVGYVFYKLALKLNFPKTWAIFFCAFVADMATYLTTSLQLAWAYPDSINGIMGSAIKFMSVFIVTQFPIAVIEGLLSVLLFNLLAENKSIKGVFEG